MLSSDERNRLCGDRSYEQGVQRLQQSFQRVTFSSRLPLKGSNALLQQPRSTGTPTQPISIAANR